MKVVCKNIERNEFAVELSSTATLDTLLSKLQELHKVDREKSTLIFSGVVHQDLSKTLDDIGFKENDWFVLYSKKLKQLTTSSPNVSSTTTSETSEGSKTSEEEASSPSGTSTAKSAKSAKSEDSLVKSSKPSETPKAKIENKNSKIPQPVTQKVKISEEAVQSLLDILLNDPNCSRLLNENPQLLRRIRDPTVLVNLANAVGLDLTRFVQKVDSGNSSDKTSSSSSYSENDGEKEEGEKDEGERVERDFSPLSESIWPSPSYTVPILPPQNVASNGNSDNSGNRGSGSGRIEVRVSAEEARVLSKIKADLMDILGELPANINEYQINTIIYECYVAAEKDPEAALNILIDHMLDQGDQADLGLGSFMDRPVINEESQESQESQEDNGGEEGYDEGEEGDEGESQEGDKGESQEKDEGESQEEGN